MAIELTGLGLKVGSSRASFKKVKGSDAIQLTAGSIARAKLQWLGNQRPTVKHGGSSRLSLALTFQPEAQAAGCLSD